MNDKKILALLEECEPAEIAYRKLYQANPKDHILHESEWTQFVN